MVELTDRERVGLVNQVETICTYKLMQAKGYELLIRKARDERIRQLLSNISANETRDTHHLLQSIQGLKRTGDKPSKYWASSGKVKFMMGVLGTRGFFEWAIIAEDEYLDDLAVHAGNIIDQETSVFWTRVVADERLHVEMMKREVLGMEGWEMGGGGGVRDVIFGANDGLVSILALVAGVYGAITQSYPIFVAGVAGAVAGAISMGAGAYLSAKSEKEVTERESKKKGLRKRMRPEQEKQELTKFYAARGFSWQEAEAIAVRVGSQLEVKEQYSIGEELGLTSEESWPPAKAGILTGLSFAVVSLIPILPFAFMSVTPAVITAVIASVISLFGVGASKAIFTRKSWIRSGLEMMIIGTLAAAATYVIGLLIPV